MAYPDNWVIIPAYNESKNIGGVIDRVKKITRNIIVVDDGSSDNTSEIARQRGVIALKHAINLGKGSSAKTGCDYVFRKKKAASVVLIDADGQHEPEDIPRFMENLKKKDIVFGYRGLNRNMPRILRLGNRLINLVIKALYSMDLRDTQCGYRAFTRRAYSKIRWKASDYSMESEMIVRAGKARLRYIEIPIRTIYSDKYKGTSVIDGIKIVLYMVLWRFSK